MHDTSVGPNLLAQFNALAVRRGGINSALQIIWLFPGAGHPDAR